MRRVYVVSPIEGVADPDTREFPSTPDGYQHAVEYAKSMAQARGKARIYFTSYELYADARLINGNVLLMPREE